MRYTKAGDLVILRIDRGEEIVSTLLEFCSGQQILLATVQGIGAVGSAEIGLFETATKEYHKKMFRGDFEITALLGSVTAMNGQPYLHLHVTLSDASYHAFGGHLTSAVVSGTCEVFIHRIGGMVGRVPDDRVGLNVFDL